MRKVGIIVVIVVLILVGLTLAKNMIAKAALSKGVEAATGLTIQIEGMNVGIMNTLIDIRHMKILNPQGFPDKVMVDIPQVYVDYDLGAFFKKSVHLESLRLNLKELMVIKNKQGELNLNSLNVVKQKKEKSSSVEEKETQVEKQQPEIRIDELQLKIGKIIYKDYSRAAAPSVREFTIGVDERYENITDLQALVSLILLKVFSSSAIAQITDFDIGPLKEDAALALQEGKERASEAVRQSKQAVEEIAGEARETIGKAGEELKKLLPFGK